jgi:hypothetical protein
MINEMPSELRTTYVTKNVNAQVMNDSKVVTFCFKPPSE